MDKDFVTHFLASLVGISVFMLLSAVFVGNDKAQQKQNTHQCKCVHSKQILPEMP